MNQTDIFKIFDLPANADMAEIKKVYRRLVREYHPDHHPGNPENEEKLKLINRAYAALRQPMANSRPVNGRPRKRPGASINRIPQWEYDFFRAQILYDADKRLNQEEEQQGGPVPLVVHLRNSIRGEPKDYVAHFLMGVLFRRRGKHRLAVELFREASLGRPNDPDLCLNLAVAYDAVEDGEGSVKNMMRAEILLRRNPDSRKLWACQKSLEILRMRYGLEEPASP